MRAILVTGSDITEEDVPLPQAGPDDLLIHVLAAGVTPSELGWYPTSHRKSGEPRGNAIPGHEFSGVVAGAVERSVDFPVGQEVFGMNDWFSQGAMAEYCVASPSGLAVKPPSLTHAQAASVPISALTAWQGLYVRAALQPGERVLVHGGAGAVGIFAIRLAQLRGAHVITTASRSHFGFLADSGAEHVIDYRHERFEDFIGPVDVVFDTVGGETLRRSWGVLKSGGRLVTIAAADEGSADARTQQAFFIVEPNGKQLAEVSRLLETGQLKSIVDTVVPLSQAPAAFRRELPNLQGRGKVVVELR